MSKNQNTFTAIASIVVNPQSEMEQEDADDVSISNGELSVFRATRSPFAESPSPSLSLAFFAIVIGKQLSRLFPFDDDDDRLSDIGKKRPR